jgi:RNA polymerase sigma factor (TIGR02999 family)
MDSSQQRSAEITGLLVAWSEGRKEALEDLLPLVYEELRRLASSYVRRERSDRPLQPTVLVHEAYLRLIDQRVHWRNRAHFFGVAAQIMRRLLVDAVRAERAEKRGAGWTRVALVDEQVPAPTRDVDLLLLDDALRRLAAFDPQQAQIVELRYFGGLTIEEAAEVLKVSPATVVREWTTARAWLRAELPR